MKLKSNHKGTNVGPLVQAAGCPCCPCAREQGPQSASRSALCSWWRNGVRGRARRSPLRAVEEEENEGDVGICELDRKRKHGPWGLAQAGQESVLLGREREWSSVEDAMKVRGSSARTCRAFGKIEAGLPTEQRNFQGSHLCGHRFLVGNLCADLGVAIFCKITI